MYIVCKVYKYFCSPPCPPNQTDLLKFFLKIILFWKYNMYCKVGFWNMTTILIVDEISWRLRTLFLCLDIFCNFIYLEYSKNFQILLPMMKKTNTDVYSHSFIAKNKSHLQIYMGSHFWHILIISQHGGNHF